MKAIESKRRKGKCREGKEGSQTKERVGKGRRKANGKTLMVRLAHQAISRRKLNNEKNIILYHKLSH